MERLAGPSASIIERSLSETWNCSASFFTLGQAAQWINNVIGTHEMQAVEKGPRVVEYYTGRESGFNQFRNDLADAASCSRPALMQLCTSRQAEVVLLEEEDESSSSSISFSFPSEEELALEFA